MRGDGAPGDQRGAQHAGDACNGKGGSSHQLLRETRSFRTGRKGAPLLTGSFFHGLGSPA
ncbi:hypothetical protein DF157_11615 [Burkholderia cenocepacia]|nr:hypothetical protein DF157_11615 [Burkholderia cenocepacia]RQV42706.1 hypothetical protein DF028_09860 [Burkholderia cenocepacia]RQV45457.1 hypothetical protein DF027_11630 [Burkholderia cenocepacia]